MVFVGANNAGKSNLLDAMRLVLGSARRFAPDPADFHQLDLGQEIRIDLHLREPLKRENAYHKTDTIHGFFLRAWRADRGGDRGQLKTEHYCIGADGKTYVPPAAAGKRRSAPDPDTEPVRWLPAPATRILPKLGRVHYLSPSLYRAFDTSGFGVLAQLLDLYREDIETSLQTEKRRDNAAHLVELIDALDVPQLPADHEIAQLADELLAFCQPQPEPTEDSAEPETPS